LTPLLMPTALDARPLLVIGGTSVGRTPYEWSQAMTEALGKATLLTSNHFGHVAITRRRVRAAHHPRLPGARKPARDQRPLRLSARLAP
jgi:TAP-like protein